MFDSTFNRRAFLGLVGASALTWMVSREAYQERKTLASGQVDDYSTIEDPITEPLPINQPGRWMDLSGHRLSRRKFPFPYQAAVTITSDIDGCTLDELGAIHEYLNSQVDTAMGRGLGLDIGDSFWMFVATDIEGTIHPDGRTLADQMSYWRGVSSDPFCAEAIRHYLKCGWMDSLHSYGDFSRKNPQDIHFTRTLAEMAAEHWKETDQTVEVWIDHGNAANVQNFGGADLDRQHYQAGDNPGSPYYHTDLLSNFGLRFVWGSTRAPMESKLGRSSLLYPRTLRDKQKLWGFYRYTNSGLSNEGNPRWLWSAHLLKHQLNSDNFRLLKENNWYASFAQHLGGHSNLYQPFRPLESEPLRMLAEEYRRGEILVTRTSRLLRYNLADLYVEWSGKVHPEDSRITIDISSIDDPHRGSYLPCVEDIRGLTFYCNDPSRVSITLNDQPIDPNLIVRNPADYTGWPSIGVAWHQPDTRNYRWDQR